MYVYAGEGGVKWGGGLGCFIAIMAGTLSTACNESRPSQMTMTSAHFFRGLQHR